MTALACLTILLAAALWRSRVALRAADARVDVLRSQLATERARATAAEQRLEDARARVLRVAETYAGPVRALPRPTSPGGDA